MKKLVYCIAALTVVFSCSSPLEPVGPDDGGGNQSSLSIQCITGDATELTSTTAKLSGTCTIKNAKAANGQAIFYYSSNNGKPEEIKTGGNKSETSSVAAEGGSFSVTLSNLTPSTKYYYVAAVSIDGKEVFGSVKSFTSAEKPKDPTVTGAATDITEWSATLSAYANPTTDMGTVTMGVLYSKNENPTLDNGQKLTSKELDGNNMYTVKASNLSSNTTYYFKSILEYGGVIRSGEVKSFTTKEIDAEVKTDAATDVGLYRATLNGQVTINSTESFSKSAWFLYSATENTVDGLKTSGKKVSVTIKSDGSFSNNFNDLTDNTTYYYVAVCKVHDVVFYGELKSFTTTDANTVVSLLTLDATEVDFFSATINGQLTANSGEIYNKDVWFLYSKSAASLDELKSSGIKIPSSLQGDSFKEKLYNLTVSTTYYYVACAYVNNKYYYGDVKSFSTINLDDLVSISTGDASNVGFKSATLTGQLTVDSQESFRKEVWFLYSDSINEIEGLKTSGIRVSSQLQANGSFNYAINDLKIDATYYYVACAKVSDNSYYYGDVKSFSTLNLADNIHVSTEEAVSVGIYKATMVGKCILDGQDNLNMNLSFLYSMNHSSLESLISNGVNMNVSGISQEGLFYGTISSLNTNTTYYYVACANIEDVMFYGEVHSFTTSDYIAVDMGVSVKWCSVNLGSNTPEDYGDYYAWGDVEPYYLEGHSLDDPCNSWKSGKTGYNWASYKWANGSGKKITKYYTTQANDTDHYWAGSGAPDNKFKLDPEDDAAHVKLGGDWRMPTREEWQELVDNCSHSVTTLNGINGLLFTSNSTGNSIFLPLAGYRSDTDLTTQTNNAKYWSSSVYRVHSDGAGCFVLYARSNMARNENQNRYYGFVIRPVAK